MFKIISKNIKVKVIILLFIVIAITSTLFSFYHYTHQNENLKQKLEAVADRKIKRLSQNLIIPLWEVDKKWVDTIIDTEMLDRELYAIIIKGEGDLYSGKKRNREWMVIDSTNGVKGKFIERSSAIVHNKEKMGEVSIYLSKKFLEDEINDDILDHLFSTLTLIFSSIIALYIILDYFILHPIKKVLFVVDTVAKGDYSQKVKFKQDDEMGQLGSGFNNMIQSVKDKEEIMLAQSRHAAMGEMISMIAHQWRQPIAVIAMGANNILANIELDMVDEKSLESGARGILKQTQELSKTIDDFRNFFRLGKVAEEILIKDVFNEAFVIIGKSLENNSIEVISEFRNNKKINTYSRELMQTLINILKNSKEVLVENKKDNKKIFIDVIDKEDSVYIDICDNGGGIKDDILPKIFEPYFSTKDEKNGTGLGLYMSKTIVEKHLDGSLNAYNKDDGACFTIKLPYTRK